VVSGDIDDALTHWLVLLLLQQWEQRQRRPVTLSVRRAEGCEGAEGLGADQTRHSATGAVGRSTAPAGGGGAAAGSRQQRQTRMASL